MWLDQGVQTISSGLSLSLSLHDPALLSSMLALFSVRLSLSGAHCSQQAYGLQAWEPWWKHRDFILCISIQVPEVSIFGSDWPSLGHVSTS